jgi:putative phage-type endonuclease
MTTTIPTTELLLPAEPETLPLPPPEQHDRWLEMRQTGIGGSDAAAALGLNRYCSAYRLWCEKRGLIEGFGGNERTLWGKLLEDVVATEAARRLDGDATKPTVMYRSRTWPWMLANPDRFLITPSGEPAVLEVKATDWRLGEEWDEEEGEAPLHYVLQVMHYLAVTGLHRGVLVCLVGGNDLRMVDVQRDEELVASLVEGERAFWETVSSGTAPQIDGASSTTEALKARYCHPEDLTTDLPAEVAALAQLRPSLIKERDDLNARIDAIENQVREAIGDATAAYVPGFDKPITWRSQDDTRLDTKALKEADPETWTLFARTRTMRVLRFPKS